MGNEKSEEELARLARAGESLSDDDFPDRSEARVVHEEDLTGDDPEETGTDIRFSRMGLYHPPDGQPECGTAEACSVYSEYIRERTSRDDFFRRLVRETCGLRIYCDCGGGRCCAVKIANHANQLGSE